MPGPSPSSLCYLLTHAHRSIGYRNIPQTLDESVVRLIYLRVYDSRATSSKTEPSPSSLCYSFQTSFAGFGPSSPWGNWSCLSSFLFLSPIVCWCWVVVFESVRQVMCEIELSSINRVQQFCLCSLSPINENRWLNNKLHCTQNPTSWPCRRIQTSLRRVVFSYWPVLFPFPDSKPRR
jgi:hypothetical protein